MNLYNRIIELVDANLIQCLVPMILTLIITDLLFKKRFKTKKVLHLICWLIISYTIFTFTFSLIGMLFYPAKFALMQRASGHYKWAYWIMFSFAIIFPLSLLLKKLSSSFYYVLFVSIFMKIGSYFERFVIIVTSFHRNYGTESVGSAFSESFLYWIILLFMQGIVIVVILLAIFEATKNLKSKGFINGL